MRKACALVLPSRASRVSAPIKAVHCRQQRLPFRTTRDSRLRTPHTWQCTCMGMLAALYRNLDCFRSELQRPLVSHFQRLHPRTNGYTERTKIISFEEALRYYVSESHDCDELLAGVELAIKPASNAQLVRHLLCQVMGERPVYLGMHLLPHAVQNMSDSELQISADTPGLSILPTTDADKVPAARTSQVSGCRAKARNLIYRHMDASNCLSQ